MPASRIAVRRLALLLCLPACHTWQPVALDPARTFAERAAVRVERADGSRAVVNGPAVEGDSLVGWDGSPRRRAAVALADVRSAEQRRLSVARTALVVVGVAAVVFALMVASADDITFD